MEKDPKEVNKLIEDPSYDTIEKEMRVKLTELQEKYLVTDKEFEKASPSCMTILIMN